jgi:hypothetical protein
LDFQEIRKETAILGLHTRLGIVPAAAMCAEIEADVFD